MTIQLIEREVPHPAPGDQVFGGDAPSYARFRFFSAEGKSWIGAFAATGINNNTLARSFGSAGDVLVVAGGQGYVVNIPQQVLRFIAEDLPGEYLFDARSIPTLLILRNGQVVARQVGALPAEALLAWVRRAIR